jgi:hypothetical protein
MRMRRTDAILTAVTLLSLSWISQWHMTPSVALADVLEDKRAKLQAKHVDAVRTFLELEPREEAAFWPVYEEYRADLAKPNGGLVQLIRDYAGTSDHLSDQEAEQLLNRFLQLKEDIIQLHYQYAGRFRQILPGRKIVRLFQIEHKLNAAVEASFADVVPLAK